MTNTADSFNKQAENKTVLITGAAGGIGRATVELFAEKDWNVIGVDRSAFGDGFPENGFTENEST